LKTNAVTLASLAAAFLVMSFNFSPALSARYYQEQTNFTETSVPLADYKWNQDSIQGCIYKESAVGNSYYVWTKLAVQKWRQALREYTGNQDWNFVARYVRSESDLASCDVKFYIYETYKGFPGYPTQTGAYTSVKSQKGQSNLDARVYLAPVVLHGDGKTEIELPSYAFRNSAVHEVGHVLGLAHMHSQKGYLMSPQFDFWEEKAQLPITTLELEALISLYGRSGFG